MKKINLILFLFLLLFAARTFAANPYWADDNGTETTWANCQSATKISGTSACNMSTVNNEAVAGNRVVFNDGDYNDSLAPVNSGTSMVPDVGAIYFQSLWRWSGGADGTEYGPKLEAIKGIYLADKYPSSNSRYLIFDGFGRDNVTSSAVSSAVYADGADDCALIYSHLSLNSAVSTYPFIYLTGVGTDNNQVPDRWEIAHNIFDVIQQNNPEHAWELLHIGSYEGSGGEHYIHDNIIEDGMGHGQTIFTRVMDTVVYNNTSVWTDDIGTWATGYGYFWTSVAGGYRNVYEANLAYEQANERNDQSGIFSHNSTTSYSIWRGNKTSWLDRVFVDMFGNTNCSWCSTTGVHNNSVYHNTIYRANQSSWSGGTPSGIIQLSTGTSATTYDVHYNFIANNIIQDAEDDVPITDAVFSVLEFAGGAGTVLYNEWTGNLLFDVDSDHVYRWIQNDQDLYTMAQAESALPTIFFDNINVGGFQDPLLADPANNDFGIPSNSPAVNAAAPITYVNGTGSGTSMVVDDNTAYRFQTHSFTSLISGEDWEPDIIYVDNPSIADFTVQISSIAGNNTLALVASKSFEDGAAVYWCPQGYCFKGSAPDVGAEEYDEEEPAPEGPTVSNKSPVDGHQYSSGTTEAPLSIDATDTDGMTGCKWDNSDTDYPSMANTMSEAAGTYTDTKTGLTDGNQYTIYGICRDGAGSPNDTSFTWTFSVAPAAGGDLIVDNLDAGYSESGSWSSSTSTGGYYGTDYRQNGADSDTDSATFTPTVSTAGQYKVYVRWTAYGDRTPNAKITVAHADGTDTNYVDQRVNGGTWNLIGTYNFNTGSGGTVTVGGSGSDGDLYYVIADAVKFEAYEAPADVVTGGGFGAIKSEGNRIGVILGR